MKRIIAIEIDCGNKTCGDCEFKGRKDDCELFQVYLEEDVLREPKCLAAEQKAIELAINAGMKTA